jgi:hypothetical protein
MMAESFSDVGRIQGRDEKLDVGIEAGDIVEEIPKNGVIAGVAAGEIA